MMNLVWQRPKSNSRAAKFTYSYRNDEIKEWEV
jgi:hypothetical protein